MKAKPIQWRERNGFGATGWHNGYLGECCLFTFGWESDKAHADKPYILTSHLPGGKRYRYANIDECKAGAARLAELFLTRLAA